LAALSQEARSELAKGLAKWAGRWQRQISKLDLPDDIREQAGSAKAPPPQPAALSPAPAAAPASVPPSPDLVAPPPTEPQPAGSREKSPRSTAHRHTDRPGSKAPPTKPGVKETVAISELLRQIEHRFEQVKAELQATRQQLRNVATANGSAGGGAATHSPELHKLREENARLTEKIEQLRGTLDELAADRFDVAISRRADTEQPDDDPLSQYQSLLTLKLREEIMKFQALNRENHLDGLPLLLENVINVLEAHGIDLSNIQPPPPPAKRRY
jgi:predicted house-cleaning noncanonical NTP pyrophosphatase (MazG superfamily)